ncbi:NAD-dependent epimerase/dehydratase family protein [Agromyces silvae]|uniref:NAD-dependent epimerase/dehydratase family protein n=1 Tax=Agromyces silvae TaxID=3388266 RepID=UPI00280B6C8F|nr:epimerase [Agromyces protaetiae]
MSGDIAVVGAGGKLGPSLVRLAARALQEAGSRSTVYAVSRFGAPRAREAVEAEGVTVLPADVTSERDLAGLPDVENVVFLVGEKFGSAENQTSTWATNTYLPGRIAERYPHARIAALSTGTVYPLVSARSGGSVEEDPVGPIGDYAMSCVGRERIFAHFADVHQSPLALIRLNYAVEMRYGVLVDLATMILEDEPIDLSMSVANVVWQGYANEVTLRSLVHAGIPPLTLNVTGPETFSIRYAAERLARLLGREARFAGEEGETAYLSNATKCLGMFGYPELTLDELIVHTAEWMLAGGATLGKPTKFQKRDGKF